MLPFWEKELKTIESEFSLSFLLTHNNNWTSVKNFWGKVFLWNCLLVCYVISWKKLEFSTLHKIEKLVLRKPNHANLALYSRRKIIGLTFVCISSSILDIVFWIPSVKISFILIFVTFIVQFKLSFINIIFSNFLKDFWLYALGKWFKTCFPLCDLSETWCSHV